MAKPICVPKVHKSKSKDFLERVAIKLFESIDSDVSREAQRALRSKDYKSLLDISIDPASYDSAFKFALDYQVVSLLKKADFLPLEVDTTQVALEKFIEAENQCSITNDYFEEGRFSPLISQLLFRTQQIIAHVLGDIPNMKGDFRFGPGATSHVSGSFVTIPDKLNKTLICPSNSVDLVLDFYQKSAPRILDLQDSRDAHGPCCWLDPKVHFELRDYNELHFVPKSAKTDRPICIEPHSLIPVQKYLGNEIRWRLHRLGIDLNKQQFVNRRLAREGSSDGTFATIDLSSASDTISLNLVSELLPLEWFDLLTQARSPYTRFPDGTIHENEKFSSMGNGFTFELETLIFASMSKACIEYIGQATKEKRMSVFGDDIIVPTAVADLLIRFLRVVGFQTNTEKTFIDGPFRESCGHDYFNGINVRPYFIKESLTYETDKIRIFNGIRHWSHRIYGDIPISYVPSLNVLRFIIESTKKPFRPAGPFHLGDLCYHISILEAQEIGVAVQGRRNQFGQTICQVAVFIPERIPLRKRAAGLGMMLSALYGCGSFIPIRGRGSVRIKRRMVPTVIDQWDLTTYGDQP